MNPTNIKDQLKYPKYLDVRYIHNSGRLAWLAQENGRGILYAKNEAKGTEQLSGNFDLRGSIGYGGGAFDTGESVIVFAESNHRLFKKSFSKNSHPLPLTSAFDQIGAPTISPDEKWVLFIAENNETPSIAIVDMQGYIWPQQLVMGADFYMQPAWHPDGEIIAWVEWDHPFMPWDGARVKIGELAGMRLRLCGESLIAGGGGKPASQPQFSPDGHWLSYIQRNGNWDDLMLFDLSARSRIPFLRGDGFHLKLPEWVQGMRSYAWSPDNRSIYHFRYVGAKTELWEIDILTRHSRQISIEPISWAVQLCVSAKGKSLAFLGSSLSIPERICELTFAKGRYSFSTSIKQALPRVQYQQISFDSGDGEKSHGIFFPPFEDQKPNCDLPPLILSVHSGPTSLSGLWFNKNVQFFTSRGYAFALLNYRGSAGFGYDYQNALKHRWGIADVADAAAFASRLIEDGQVDKNRIAIMGSSAGGFTALNALIAYPHVFSIGICSYGVSDLLQDASNTHKFERYYHQFLTGDIELDRQRFIDRSPINHVEEITNPVLLFHGTNDKVVDINQTKQIFNALQKKKVPSRIVIYDGEGHGFRLDGNIIDFYQQVEDFLDQFFK